MFTWDIEKEHDMKILGICGSGRDEKTSGCYKLVERVLKATEVEYELVSLRGKTIKGCTSCLGCVKDNVCVIKDDMTELREKFIAADAWVIGAPNFYSNLNATTHAMLERLYQFRHRTGDLLWGKLAVAIGVGGASGAVVADNIETMLGYSFIETVDKVCGQGAAACFTCGYGETCQVGLPYVMFGPDVRITEEMIPDVEKQVEVMAAADAAGKKLAMRLASHDREAVTQKMLKAMMAKFNESS